MKKFIIILLILTPAFNVVARNSKPPAPKGFAPPPALPIDQYLIPLFIIGIFIYYWKVQLKKN